MTFVGAVGRDLLPTDALWRGAVFHLEPAAVLLAYAQAGRNVAAVFPFAATQPPRSGLRGLVRGLDRHRAAASAGWSFRRREL